MMTEIFLYPVRDGDLNKNYSMIYQMKVADLIHLNKKIITGRNCITVFTNVRLERLNPFKLHIIALTFEYMTRWPYKWIIVLREIHFKI